MGSNEAHHSVPIASWIMTGAWLVAAATFAWIHPAEWPWWDVLLAVVVVVPALAVARRAVARPRVESFRGRVLPEGLHVEDAPTAPASYRTIEEPNDVPVRIRIAPTRLEAGSALLIDVLMGAAFGAYRFLPPPAPPRDPAAEAMLFTAMLALVATCSLGFAVARRPLQLTLSRSDRTLTAGAWQTFLPTHAVLRTRRPGQDERRTPVLELVHRDETVRLVDGVSLERLTAVAHVIAEVIGSLEVVEHSGPLPKKAPPVAPPRQPRPRWPVGFARTKVANSPPEEGAWEVVEIPRPKRDADTRQPPA